VVRCNFCGATGSAHVFSLKGFDLVRCAGCSLTFIANPPQQHELADIYSVGASNYHSELLDTGSAQAQRMRLVAAEHMEFSRPFVGDGQLVDVGCSVGHFLELAAQAGVEARGIEYCKETAQHAATHTGLPVERGSIHDSALAPESCATITMFDVIEHVPDPQADLQAAWRLLKPGGCLILSTPNIDGLFPRASRPFARPLGYWPHPEPPHHLYQFSLATLAGKLEELGFVVEKVSHRHIALDYTFGTWRTLIRSPKRLAYAMVFAPLARLGPLLSMGDWFYLAARKPADAPAEAIAA
jgi:2-polyprenyl-3-methyl-5-hydroxy-6-metoxy-1,4-benzoquinol methylase